LNQIEKNIMPTLKGSQTLDNLKNAFASEAQANRRYLYFARQADIEGYPEIAGCFGIQLRAKQATRRATSIG
jgi:rubrerythrin